MKRSIAIVAGEPNSINSEIIAKNIQTQFLDPQNFTPFFECMAIVPRQNLIIVEIFVYFSGVRLLTT